MATLSSQLKEQYGHSFEEKNLRRMLQFADIFSEKEKVVTLSRHLSWSHFLILIPLKTTEQRQFYTQQAITEQLSVRALRRQIAQKAYERTTIANAQLADGSHYLSDNFKDPLPDFDVFFTLSKDYWTN